MPGAGAIVLGDINSSPDDPIIPQPIQSPPFAIPPPFDTTIVPPYAQFALSGWVDVWNARPGKPPGFTCCHDEDLSVLGAPPDERIDVILSKAPLARRSMANVMRQDPGDRVLGLWPSDHDTVYGELNF